MTAVGLLSASHLPTVVSPPPHLRVCLSFFSRISYSVWVLLSLTLHFLPFICCFWSVVCGSWSSLSLIIVTWALCRRRLFPESAPLLPLEISSLSTPFLFFFYLQRYIDSLRESLDLTRRDAVRAEYQRFRLEDMEFH